MAFYTINPGYSFVDSDGSTKTGGQTIELNDDTAQRCAYMISPAPTPVPRVAASNEELMDWALSQTFRVVSATRDGNGAITTASIVWPDGATGTFTADALSTSFPGATDAWHATYNSFPVRTVTQPAVSRDANGAVTAQPAITIS